ncbi:MAG TPA: hypothetical protein VGP63_22120 [Planctomycetaceae bacterium]|jgi:hypothetical protein|nr:hypothetical protein [Planctomycetaceae bacterium]
MLSPARHSGQPGPKLLVLFLLGLAAVEGCGPPNAKDKFDQAFKNNPEFKQVQVAPFSGRVTIDGQPPGEDMSVFVILNDPQKLKKPGEARVSMPMLKCDPAGNFTFMTYVPGDGPPVGKYVVMITALKKKAATKAGLGGMSDGATVQYLGPDMLKNLYNDPEKNQKDPNFVIDLQPPGIPDKQFNLVLEGKDPVVVPSNYAPKRLTSDE